ncbi:MAG: glycosyltransferase family 39 protein, partial [Devosia sp.]
MNASAAADDLDAGSAGRTGVRLDLLVIAGLVVAALLLRLYGLTAQSLWEDEVATWQQARLDLDGLIRATAADNYPPLHNLIVHLSLQVFGDTPWALRFPSAVLGALTVGALYWTGLPVIGRVGALIAALLLCVSSFHLWYSQEARSYALLGLAATL